METDASICSLLTRRELADTLRVSLSTIDRLRRRGVLRPVRLVPNGAVRFRAADVEALLDLETRPPHTARAEELSWR
ncbi:MAG: helix-turn-helix transcriptional regulator [Gaiellaceae bacterium]